MKKTIGWLCGIAAAVAAFIAVIKLINRKRFKEQVFEEKDDDNEDIFEDEDSLDDKPVYVSDRTGDGNIDTFMMDTTGDGKIDTVLLDTTGDGEVDTVLTDTTGDGELDTIYTDFN